MLVFFLILPRQSRTFKSTAKGKVMLKIAFSPAMFWVVTTGIAIIILFWRIDIEFNKLTSDLRLTRKQKILLWLRIGLALLLVHILYMKFFKSTEEVVRMWKERHQNS